MRRPRFSRYAVIQTALLLLFLGRIVSGYFVFSATYDEHAHIGRGMLWLETGVYEDDGFQMPLPRLLFAVLPHWDGYHAKGSWLFNDWTNQTAHDYWRSLTLARAGNLPFAMTLFLAVAAFARRLYGDRASLAASAALTCCPNVIGHAALATLDIAGAAGVMLALFAAWNWRQRPHAARAALAGAAAGVAQLSKFSSAGFLAAPLLFTFWLACRKGKLSWKSATLHALCFSAAAWIVIWAGFEFETGEVRSFRHLQAIEQCKAPLPIGNLLQGARLPAQKLWRGIVDIAYLQREGFPAFLTGEMRDHGWWRYFPVAFLLKVTPPLLLLALLGFWMSARHTETSRESAGLLGVAALGIFAVSLPSTVNIGVRHTLAVFPILCVAAAGVFAAEKHTRSSLTVFAILLLGWHAAESVVAHPDYLAYFNPFVRAHDFRYLSDSNLDWGQDRARFAEWLAANRDKDVYALAMNTGDILKLSEPPQGTMESEWIVMTTNQWAIVEFGGRQREETRRLFEREPWGRIGRSMLIFHFPERAKQKRE